MLFRSSQADCEGERYYGLRRVTEAEYPDAGIVEKRKTQKNMIDGICRSKTVAVIITYQKSCKITANGLAGQTTRKYLATA